MLLSNKIFANEWLMIVHIACFCVILLCMIIEFALYLGLIGIELEDYDQQQMQRFLIYLVIDIVWSFTFGLLYITVMIMFKKQSVKIDPEQRQLVAYEFMLVFSSREELLAIDEDRIQEVKAERYSKFLEEMANAQIKNVLDAMYSVSQW